MLYEITKYYINLIDFNDNESIINESQHVKPEISRHEIKTNI